MLFMCMLDSVLFYILRDLAGMLLVVPTINIATVFMMESVLFYILRDLAGMLLVVPTINIATVV